MLKFVCFSYILLIEFVTGEDGPIISIPQGSVQGVIETSYGGREYSAFEGIPYGKPPIDELRFAEPEPAEKWDGVLLANQTYRCLCFYAIPFLYGIKGTEDCLYMYVYVPLKEIHGNESLDVIVHIHGGAFMLGAPVDMASPVYMMDKDVVFVSFNYRLAILGFLSTEDEVVPGNNGLKDQTLALRWIRDNIRYFGGNPDSVTLTGLSAGGASVHYHYFSPLSRGLFHRGYSLSGTALLSWALTEKPLKKAEVVAKHVQCPTNSTKLMVDCLRKVKGNDLLEAMKKLTVYMEAVPVTPFGPVIEKGEEEHHFLSHHPYQLLMQGKVYDVPWVASNVRDEGIYPTAFFVMANKLSEMDARWQEIMPFALDIQDTVEEDLQQDVVRKVRKYYFEDEPVSEDNQYSMIRMFSDRLFFIDGEKSIRAHAKASKSPVYYYFFTYLLQQPFIIPGFRKGVSHCDDSRLLFKMIGTPRRLEADDEKMMQIFTEFITLYAKTNKPSINNIEWKPVDWKNKSMNVLRVHSPDDISMEKYDEIGSNEFWNSFPIMENDKITNFT